VTVRVVRGCQTLENVSYPFLFRYVTIPIAWPVTVVFARLGFDPNQMTLIRSLVVVSALALIAHPTRVFHLVGIALMAFGLILDHVDGNLARLRDKASYFGKLFDGFVDSASEILLPLVVALHVWQNTMSVGALLAGVAASLALALTQIVMFRYGMVQKEIDLARLRQGELQSKLRPGLSRFLYNSHVTPIVNFVNTTSHNLMWDLRYGLLLVLEVVNEMTVYLYTIALSQGVLAVLFIPVRLCFAFVEYDIHRRSRTAVQQVADGN